MPPKKKKNLSNHLKIKKKGGKLRFKFEFNSKEIDFFNKQTQFKTEVFLIHGLKFQIKGQFQHDKNRNAEKWLKLDIYTIEVYEFSIRIDTTIQFLIKNNSNKEDLFCKLGYTFDEPNGKRMATAFIPVDKLFKPRNQFVKKNKSIAIEVDIRSSDQLIRYSK